MSAGTRAATIAVVGATGRQGGGLVRAIHADPDSRFRARALTRTADAPASRALAALGAEVVAADLDDPASVARAFEGAVGAYCVTNFWAHGSPAREIAQARAMARAAEQASVRHVVWSTLEDTRIDFPLDDERMPTVMGAYKVPHFDAKAEADAHFLASGVPLTRLYPSFYWESFVSAGAGPKAAGDGTLVLRLPLGDRPLAGVAAADIGAAAYGIFQQGAALHGARIGVAGAQLTGDEMAAAMARALRRHVRYEAITPASYRASGSFGAVELGNMFQYYSECADSVCRVRDVATSRRLHPGLLDFDAWLARFASTMPLE